MRRLSARSLLTAALSLLLCAGAPARAQYVGDFALLDHTGKFHQLSYYGDEEAVVLAVHRAGLDATERSLAQFRALRERYADQPVRFFMINAMPAEDRVAVDAAVRRQGLDVPVLLDTAQLVAQRLDLRHVGEVMVLDPERQRLTYRSTLASGQAQGLIAAIDARLAGAPAPDEVPAAPTPASVAAADRVTYPVRDALSREPVSYSRDIVPILENNCVACHTEGGIAPWAMTSHRMVQGFGPMIKEVVTTRRMPPGQIDQHQSKPIRDVAGLSPLEQQQLIHWIDAGAPIDGSEDPLTAVRPAPSKFTMGEPDLVYRIPAQEIPATGVLDYRYVPLKLNLEQDVWVRAMEFVPGDRQVLHHVIAYLQSPADRSREGRRDTVARGESVGGFAPGRVGEDFGPEGGRLLQKGANLLLQMHYTTSGKPSVDETEIGIYLHDAPPKYVMKEVVAAQRRFMVPPHAKEHQLQGEQLIERDAYLHAMMPHMHYRGKYMNYTAVYPDGTSERLLSVPRYDFNWQFNYELEEPVFLPAGTRLIASGAMDNSARNRGNPDPSRPVHFGLQTQHEMFFGFTTLRYVDVVPQVASVGEE